MKEFDNFELGEYTAWCGGEDCIDTGGDGSISGLYPDTGDGRVEARDACSK